MKLLSKYGIIVLNEETILNDGGNFMPPNNILNESSLDYLVEIVEAEMFGEPLYPSLSDTAAVYFFNIICNHIFTDGNKRTGLLAALTFLDLNGFQLNDSITNKILENFVIKVASGESHLEECREWFKKNIVQI